MSDVNLTVQEGSDVYLSLTETPAVVSVTNPLVAAASFSVTVGTSVTVSNFPATQGISGTVTANVSAVGNAGETIPDGALVIGLEVGGTLERVSNNVPLPVTAVGGVTIGSLPAISGTVTANLSESIASEVENGLNAYAANYNEPLPIALPVGVASLPVSGTVTASLSSANLNSVTVGVRGSVTVANFPATQVVSVSNFPSSSSVTIANFPAVTTVAGTVALDSASLAALESVTVTIGAAVSISNFPTTQVVSVSNFPVSSSVTIGGFSTSSLPPSTVTVANTVTVALDSASLIALENVTVTVGAAVTVAGFSTSSLPPSTVTVGNTVTINGTVTANAGDFASDYGQDQAPPNRSIAIGWGSDSFSLFQTTGEDAPLPVQIINGTLTPAIVPISGTVTVNSSALYYDAGNAVTYSRSLASWVDGDVYPAGLDNPLPVQLSYFSSGNLLRVSPSNPIPTQVVSQGSVTIGSCVTHGVRLQDGLGNNLTSTSIGGVQRLNVSLASAATPGGSLPSFVNVYGGSDGSAVRTIAVDSSGRTVVTVANFPATQAVSLASTTVTVSNVAGFNIPTHDFKSFAYTSGNLTQIAYRTGGASGTTVGILTLAYDGSGNLTSMTRT